MSRVLWGAIIALGVLAGQAAQATVVVPVAGKTSVNFGGGYIRVGSTSVVQAGDQVMVGSSGFAKVVYNKKCVVKVAPGAVYTIQSVPPCEGLGALPADHDAFALGGLALGVTGAAILFNRHNSPASP